MRQILSKKGERVLREAFFGFLSCEMFLTVVYYTN